MSRNRIRGAHRGVCHVLVHDCGDDSVPQLLSIAARGNGPWAGAAIREAPSL